MVGPGAQRDRCNVRGPWRLPSPAGLDVALRMFVALIEVAAQLGLASRSLFIAHRENLGPTMTSHIKPIATSEYDAVIAAAQAYIDGYRAGDMSEIERAFHQDSIMWGYSGEELLQGAAVPVFASFFDSLGASPNVRSRLDILAIAPTAAVVRVDMENDVIGASFHDYLSLLKIDGQWKIISKVFQRYS